jgi:hypothetical protein
MMIANDDGVITTDDGERQIICNMFHIHLLNTIQLCVSSSVPVPVPVPVPAPVPVPVPSHVRPPAPPYGRGGPSEDSADDDGADDDGADDDSQ